MGRLRFAGADAKSCVFTSNGTKYDFTVSGEVTFRAPGVHIEMLDDSQARNKKEVAARQRTGMLSIGALSTSREQADFNAIFGRFGMTLRIEFADDLAYTFSDLDCVSDADSLIVNKTTGKTGELKYQYSSVTLNEPTA